MFQCLGTLIKEHNKSSKLREVYVKNMHGQGSMITTYKRAEVKTWAYDDSI